MCQVFRFVSHATTTVGFGRSTRPRGRLSYNRPKIISVPPLFEGPSHEQNKLALTISDSSAASSLYPPSLLILCISTSMHQCSFSTFVLSPVHLSTIVRCWHFKCSSPYVRTHLACQVDNGAFWKSLKEGLRFHTGTAAFGSLIIAIIKVTTATRSS